ncbi:MAG: Type 1 glutamine amidotransferase-like domain-containing protein [Actinomycetota bacterium]
MAGAICLQGGREFTSDCMEMDRSVVEMAPTGDAVVLAGAARIGDDYAGACRRATTHYASLGVEAVPVPDPRTDERAALDVLDGDVALIILPGGSPAGLLAVLTDPESDELTPVGARVVELHRAGTVISGASAGAMVLCDQTAMPERRLRRGPATRPALGLVEGLAIPHWSAAGSTWKVPDDLTLWGLPECGGVIVERHGVVAVGEGTPSRRISGQWQPVERADRSDPV